MQTPALDVEIACDALRERILSGELAPGALLSQRTLAEEMGLGHTPVRTAIQILAYEGLLKVLPRRGTVVAELSQQDLQEIFEIRLGLECVAASLAAHYGPTRDLTRLAALLTDIWKAPRYEISAAQEVGWSFHNEMFRAAKNRRLAQMYDQLRGQSGIALRKLNRTDIDVSRRGTEEHLQIYAAIEARDVEGARTLMWNHVLRGNAGRMRVITERSQRASAGAADNAGGADEAGAAGDPYPAQIEGSDSSR